MATPESIAPVKNRILIALPAEERARLISKMETVYLEQGQILNSPEEPIRDIYFVNDALISVLSLLRDGATIEVGTVGREGISDTSVLLGSDITVHQALVQIPGSALRVKTEVFKEEVKRCEQLQLQLLRYARLLLAQVSQVVVCNSLHSIEERLARWLLMGAYRVGSNELLLTQEFLSHMLGVRRAGVTVAARLLQSVGLIKYNRGHITILDEEGLEVVACECYQIIREDLHRFLES